MTLRINIPDDHEKILREAWGNGLDRAVLEALAIEGYRSRRFTLMQVGRLLGMDDRWTINQWLADRHVWLDYTADDLEREREALARLTRKPD